MNDTHLYPYSAKEARKRNELSCWRDSFHANIACKVAIEEAIRQGFDGMHLDEASAKAVLSEFGYKRTAFVLAATLKEKGWDDRFSQTNRMWAKTIFVPEDGDHNRDLVVSSHPAVLDGFVDQYRKGFQALDLFGASQCEPNSRAELNYEGKVLVLSPDTLAERCWSRENQLWYAHDGFGCSPHAVGRSVRCTCLGDGEMTRWDRAEFVGILKEECMPDWAREKLLELTAPEQAGPAVAGMTMK